jgi:hypothetical protein
MSESIHAIGRSQIEPRMRARAEAKIAVQNSEAKPYDQTASPVLMEIHLSETFSGDTEGESPVRAFTGLARRSICQHGQRFHGKLGGREGTFVLQGSEIVESGKIKATWFVVPCLPATFVTDIRNVGETRGKFNRGARKDIAFHECGHAVARVLSIGRVGITNANAIRWIQIDGGNPHVSVMALPHMPG